MLCSLRRKFLTTFTLSIMKSLDIRSESAVKLISEFLDMDQAYLEGNPHPNAEHLAHGMLSFFLGDCLLSLIVVRSCRTVLVSTVPLSRSVRIRQDGSGEGSFVLHLGVLYTPPFDFYAHLIFLNSTTNRKIPRVTVDNEGTIWG